MKKSSQALLSDVKKRPLRTLFLALLFLAAILAFDATRAIVSNQAASLFDQSETFTQQAAVASGSSSSASSTAKLTPRHILDDNNQFEIDVKYPSFNVPDFDKTVADFIAGEITSARYEDYGEVSDEAKKGINARYDVPYIDSNIISFREYICWYVYIAVDIQSRCLDREHGFNFDRRTGQLIKLEDVLKMIDLSLEELADEIKKKYSDTANEPMFSDGFRPINDNFSEFLVTKDSVTFLFQKYQLGPGVMGSQEVTFNRIK